MVKVLEVSLQLDLSEFAAFLWHHQIPHRIMEEGECQQLWVSAGINPQRINQLFELWRSGADLSQVQVQHNPAINATPAFDLHRLPVTLMLIVASVLIALLTGFGDNFELLRYFTIADLIQQGDSLYTPGLDATLESGQLWRLLTPVFLHFNIPHLAFNLLWIWVVAARIERLQGLNVLLGLVVLSGLASNLAQYTVSGPLFGGMSGVVFAVLGYTWLWDRQRKVTERFNLPPALMALMVIWLALGFSGVLEGVGMGAVANTAHLVGLLAGLAFVPLVAVLRRR